MISISSQIQNHLHKTAWMYIAFFWCFGLSFGMLCGFQGETSQCFDGQLSGAGGTHLLILIAFHLCLFLASILFIRFRMTTALFPVVFLKSFLLGFSFYCYIQIFGSAGWLIKLFAGFLSTVNSVLLLYFWLFCSSRAGQWCIKPFALILAISVSACFIDYYFISPICYSLIG